MKRSEEIGQLFIRVAEEILPTLSAHSQAVLNQMLFQYARSEGDSFECDSATLSRRANLAPGTLRTAIKTLQSMGLVEVLERGSSHRPTRYRLGFGVRREVPGSVMMRSKNPPEALSVVKHLDFPYNWANKNMNDVRLVKNVLRKNRFSDVMSVCAQYGIDMVDAIASTIKDHSIRAAAEQTLMRIRIGREKASEGSQA